MSQLNVRLPVITEDQISLVMETYGLTKTQVVVLAIDRLAATASPDKILVGTRKAIEKVKQESPSSL